MSMIRKLATAFQSGRTLTTSDIKKLGLRNPTASVNQLRNEGYCIYTNADGYRLGTPTKRMVAIANMVLGSAAFKRV